MIFSLFFYFGENPDLGVSINRAKMKDVPVGLESAFAPSKGLTVSQTPSSRSYSGGLSLRKGKRMVVKREAGSSSPQEDTTPEKVEIEVNLREWERDDVAYFYVNGGIAGFIKSHDNGTVELVAWAGYFDDVRVYKGKSGEGGRLL